MRDWIDIQHQQHQYVLPPEFQQILASRNLASSGAPGSSGAAAGHFLGISREPLSPPAAAPQQQQHFPNHHLQFFQQQQSSALPLKHLLGRGEFLDRGRPDQECEHGGGGEEAEDDGWSSDEARALIRIRRDLDSSFRSLSSPQLHLWDEISRRLGTMGFVKDGRDCKEKFDSMSKHYRRTREPGAMNNGTSERFIEELDAFYGSNNNNNTNNSVLTSGPEFPKPGNPPNPVTDQGPGKNHQDQAQNDAPATNNVAGAAAAQDGEPSDHPEDHHEHQQQQEQNYDVNSSSESSAEYDEPGEENRNLRKRRRKSWKARMAFFESLVRKFIERQEQTQQRFLELLDKRDQERSKRDEVWRKQEMARLNREYELRFEEHARRTNYDAAFSSALQKASGNLNNINNNNNTTMNNNNNNNITSNNAALVLSQGPIPSPYSNESNEDQHQHQLQLQQGGDSMNKRWPKAEVQALIQLRAAMEAKFQEVGPKGPFWEEISSGLACQGYVRSAKRCKEKWENINKYYRKTSNKKRPENTKTCPYFQELDLLYQKGVIRGGSLSNNNAGLVIHNNTSKIEETTDENREESGSREAEAEVLSIMPPPESQVRNQLLFSNGENCVHNTESTSCGAEKQLQQQQQQLSKMKTISQKRNWSECENGGGGLGLSFEALQQGAELMMCSNKSLKFSTPEHQLGSGVNVNHHPMSVVAAQQQQNHHQLQQELNHRSLMERQSQEFQEVESSATNLVDGFGLVRARAV